MTPDETDWWTRLMYEDPTPARELRACHLVKWHVSVVRHLATGHGIRFEGQGPRTALDVVIEQHKSLHGPETDWRSHHVCAAAVDCASWATEHPHAASR